MHMHYNQLISVQVLEDKNSGAVYSVDNDITFIFIAQKNESAMVKCKLHPRQKKAINTAALWYQQNCSFQASARAAC